jgi:transposase
MAGEASSNWPTRRCLLSPIALEAVKRIDVLFAIEREINGQPAEARLAARQQRILPLPNALEAWMWI